MLRFDPPFAIAQLIHRALRGRHTEGAILLHSCGSPDPFDAANAAFSAKPKGISNGWFSKWQVFSYLTRHFGTRLFW